MRLYFAVLLLFTVAGPTSLRAGTVVLNFEGFSDGTSLTTQYPGVTFSNATVISAGITLNEFELPPHSGTNVVFDDGGPMTISFANPILSFGGYFTYYKPLALAAFNASQTQVDSALSAFSINVGCDPGPFCLGDPGSSPNEFLKVTFPSGISRVTITGDPVGTSFALDDMTYTSTVPEPSAVPSFLLCVIILLYCKRNKTATHAKT